MCMPAKKRVVAGGNYRAENDGIHKGCSGGSCKMKSIYANCQGHQ